MPMHRRHRVLTSSCRLPIADFATSVRSLSSEIAARAPSIVLHLGVGMRAETIALASLRLAPVQCCLWDHRDHHEPSHRLHDPAGQLRRFARLLFREAAHRSEGSDAVRADCARTKEQRATARQFSRPYCGASLDHEAQPALLRGPCSDRRKIAHANRIPFFPGGRGRSRAPRACSCDPPHIGTSGRPSRIAFQRPIWTNSVGAICLSARFLTAT